MARARLSWREVAARPAGFMSEHDDEEEANHTALQIPLGPRFSLFVDFLELCTLAHDSKSACSTGRAFVCRPKAGQLS